MTARLDTCDFAEYVYCSDHGRVVLGCANVGHPSCLGCPKAEPDDITLTSDTEPPCSDSPD